MGTTNILAWWMVRGDREIAILTATIEGRTVVARWKRTDTDPVKHEIVRSEADAEPRLAAWTSELEGKGWDLVAGPAVFAADLPSDLGGGSSSEWEAWFQLAVRPPLLRMRVGP